MTVFNGLSKKERGNLMRAYIIERHIPIRVLKYLRKHFSQLILAYSGGTDSTLLLLACKNRDIILDGIVFCNTRMEYIDTLQYVHTIIPLLGYQELFNEVFPGATVKELGQMIIEDFDKNLYSCTRYDKSDYRCCYHAKEKPMRQYMQTNDLCREDVCILRGMRMVDNSNRMLSGLTLIETGQFYYYNYKHGLPAKTSNPLWTVTDDAKQRWLTQLCKQYKIPLPQKSGCMLCPIYYTYASKEERQEARFKIAQRFIEGRSRQKIPFYTTVSTGTPP